MKRMFNPVNTLIVLFGIIIIVILSFSKLSFKYQDEYEEDTTSKSLTSDVVNKIKPRKSGFIKGVRDNNPKE